jgi:hypothetical protein
MVFESFTNTKLADEAWLISPRLDLSNTDKASMFFDLSYALNQGRVTNEKLRVVASLNCDNAFDLTLYNNAGQSLSDLISNTNWTPESDADWTRQFVNLSSLTGNADVRIAFVITNGRGNNLYIDNIEFFNSDAPVQPNVSDPFYIYYNTQQTEADFFIKFNLPEQQPVSINIVDTMGRSIYNFHLVDILNETFPVTIDDIASGIYIMQFKTQQQTHAARVFIGK